jgi:hypothetical protein
METGLTDRVWELAELLTRTPGRRYDKAERKLLNFSSRNG